MVITDWTLELRQKRGTPVGCSVRAQPQRAWKYGDKRVRTGEVRQGGGTLYNSGSAQFSVRVIEEQRETGLHSYHAYNVGLKWDISFHARKTNGGQAAS